MTHVVEPNNRTRQGMSADDAKRTLLRSATTRYGTKHTTGGREKMHPPRTPSLPRLKFLDKPEADQ
jgi:hypothetical protein